MRYAMRHGPEIRSMLRIDPRPDGAQLLVKEQSAQNLVLSTETGAAHPVRLHVRNAFAATIFCISATNRF